MAGADSGKCERGGAGREKVAARRTLAFTRGGAEEFFFAYAPSRTAPTVDLGVRPEPPLLRPRPRVELAGPTQRARSGKRA